MQESEIKALAEEIRGQLREVPSKNSEYCIGRASKRLKEAHKICYIPMTVSIGPLHHNRKDLTTMEKYKQQYTRSFLEQTPHLFLEDYLKAIQCLEEKTRKCYGEEIEYLSSKKFKKMILFDGCFIIQLFLRFNYEVPRSENDRIFGRIGLLNRIRRDLILFENQLPFFVLQCLFNLSTVFNGGPSLINLALNFFADIIPGHISVSQEKGPDIKHLLDLLRHSYAHDGIDKKNPLDYDPEVLIYSATDLKIRAGVKFRKASKAESLLDIKFYSNGLLVIPKLKLQAETETLFRNIMAFEQCCERSNAYITDYISFLGCLIKSWDDANLLCDIGIIQSFTSSPVAISDLFRSLSKELAVYNCHYCRLCKKVNSSCCIKQWQLWIEKFMDDCCPVFNFVGFFLVLFCLAWTFGYILL